MIKIFYFFVLGILLMSCTDENIRIEKEGNEGSAKSAFYKVYSSEANNQLLIENFGGIYDTNSTSKVSAHSLNGMPMSLTVNGKKIEVPVKIAGKGGGWQVSNYDAKSLFGHTLSIKTSRGRLTASIDNKTITRGLNGDIDIYIPEIITAQVFGLDANRNIVPGTVITWNKDVNNRNGISIMVEYSPYQQTDSDAYFRLMPESERRFVNIEDTGSYTVTKEDLINYPEGTNLSFYIGRSAYTVTNGGVSERISDASIGAITAVRADFRIAY